MRDESGDKARFQHILSVIYKLESLVNNVYYDEFISSDLIQSAVERQLEIIMECSFQ